MLLFHRQNYINQNEKLSLHSKRKEKQNRSRVTAQLHGRALDCGAKGLEVCYPEYGHSRGMDYQWRLRVK